MTDTGKSLFRFQTIRPVRTDFDAKLRIEYEGEPTPFLASIRQARESNTAENLAKAFIEKSDFFRASMPKRSVFGPAVEFMGIVARIDRTQPFDVARDRIIEKARQSVGRDALERVVSNEGDLWDHYVAANLVATVLPVKRAALADCLRATLVSRDLQAVEDWKAFDALMGALPVLPDWLVRRIAGHLHQTFPYVAGFADLMVVKEEWVRYERGEIAHIENVMATETRSRTLRKLDSTTVTSTVESERTEETSKESERSIHNAVANEIEKTISTEMGLATGVTISGKYGPAVKVDATASFDFTTATEETRNSSEEFAQDLVERASSKVTTRERRETVTVLLSETEDTVAQSFSNNTSEHVIGVYRHVDQVWRAQVYNYGRRLMLDLVVPEPSVNWRTSKMDGAIPDERLVPPPTLDIDPAEITVPGAGGTSPGSSKHSAHYTELAAKYGATDVPPPPDTLRFVHESLQLEVPDRGGNRANSTSQKTAELTIPEGYVGVEAEARFFALTYNNDAVAKLMINGREQVVTARTESIKFPIAKVSGMMKYGMYLDEMQGGILSLKIKCEITAEAWAKWQMDVFAAIKRANDRAWEAHEAKKAQKQALTSLQQETMHPDAKHEVERNELKRATIAMLARNDHHDRQAIKQNTTIPQLLPTIDFPLADTEGAYARFFEEAFEWPEMTYLYYPYFWARQSEWYKLMHERDPDLLFEAFLKSGAARVNLAVRPGFEAAVLWFMATGEIWGGGPVPGIGDPLYVALIDEIVEGKGLSLDNPKPVGDPWEYTMPTHLVVLDPDDRLIPPPVEPPPV